MKTLLILRHAKTQPDAPAGDHARALTERGHRDAATIAAHIRALIGTPDAIATSNATRAQQTASIVADAVGFPSSPAEDSRIYNASLGSLVDVVRDLPDTASSAVIIGHNPGFETLASALSHTPDMPVRLPTAGLAVLDFDAPSWSNVEPGTGQLREVTSPKELSQG